MFARRRPLLRAAVVGGGAYMAGKATARRSAERADQDAAQEQRISNLENAQQQPTQPDQPQVPEPRAGQAPKGPDVMSQLNELVQMHDRGALTDEEFTAAKAHLLG
jgi:hypothetical protein